MPSHLACRAVARCARILQLAAGALIRASFFFTSTVIPAIALADEARLTLESAVERALGDAPQVVIQTSALEAAQSLLVSAGRLPDPELVVGVDNLPIDGPDAYSVARDFMTMRKVGVMQEFPRRAKRRLERERVQADIDAANAELVQTRLDVARAVSDAWIRRSALETSLVRLRALAPEVELQAAAARAALASGRSSAAEALAAEATVAELTNRVLATESDVRRAELELARWIGDAGLAPLAAPPAFDRLPVPEEVLLAAPHEHAAILPFESRIAGARAEVELARAERRPDWSAELAFAKRGPEFSDMASLQFRIELPLFARHRQNPVIAARRADLRRMEAEREAEVRMHTAEVRQRLVEWRLFGKQLERYERDLLPLARERSQAALATYSSGRGDVRLAIDAFAHESELLIQFAALQEARGRAWAYLRYLTPHQVEP